MKSLRTVMPVLLGVPLLLAAGCRAGFPERNADVPRGSEPGLEESVARLDADLTRWEAFGFSGAVLVARGQRTLLSKGYGLANRRHDTAITHETLFDIGSLAKQFTAAAILNLAEDGRVAVHDSIASLLPDVPPDKRSITLHHLLTHTSGISDFGTDSQPVGRDELVRQILGAPLTHSPGETYEYSNLGYSLLAAIIEIASGRRFEDYLAGELFAPAGLRHTGFTWAPAAGSAGGPALGYGAYGGAQEGEDPRDRVRSWRSRGSGDVLSTVEDLQSWERALAAGRVLGSESLEAMFTAHTKAEAEFLSYGYGWRIQSTVDGKLLIWHSGLEGAYSAMLRRYVDEDIVLIFLSNLSIGGVPMREILVPPSRSGPPSGDLFAEAVAAPPTYAENGSIPTVYEGRYKVGQGARWQVKGEGPAVVLRAEGQEAIDALFPPANASIADDHEKASREAVRIARCIAEGTCASDAGLARIDPLGYARREAPTVARDWQGHGVRLGPLRTIRALGTTGLRGRRPEQMLTFLRLEFARGAVDEHLIWFADDEIYLVEGFPSTFEIRFRRGREDGLVGFDLLSQRSYHARLLEGHLGISIRSGARTTEAPREP